MLKSIDFNRLVCYNSGMKLFLCKTEEFFDLAGIDFLPAYRREKIERYKNNDDKIRSLVGGLLLRYAFGKRADEIAVDANGKPYLDGENFNLSHTDGIVALAVAHAPVGVDIEKVRPVNFAVSNKIFSESETEFLSTFNQDEKSINFFDIWVGKESVCKAIGSGLTSLSKTFSLLPLTDGYYRAFDKLFYLRWLFEGDYRICLASENIEPLDIVWLNKTDLLR